MIVRVWCRRGWATFLLARAPSPLLRPLSCSMPISTCSRYRGTMGRAAPSLKGCGSADSWPPSPCPWGNWSSRSARPKPRPAVAWAIAVRLFDVARSTVREAATGGHRVTFAHRLHVCQSTRKLQKPTFPFYCRGKGASDPARSVAACPCPWHPTSSACPNDNDGLRGES